jgi:type I restriction enzyme, S subunit
MAEVITLGEACVKIVDCEHKTAPEAVPGTEYGYSVGTPHIRNGRILLGAAKRVDKETYAGWTVREVPRDDDLILAREAPVGQVGRIAHGERICLGQRTVLLRPDIAKIDPRYLHYLLLSPAVQEAMASKAAGSTVAHLNVKDIRELPLPSLPVRSYQVAVADLLAALDDKITVNERIAAMCYEISRACFRQAISSRPEDSQVGDLFEFKYGKALREPDRRDGDVPVYGCTGQVGWHDTSLSSGSTVIVGRKGANAGWVSWSKKSCWIIDTAFYVSARQAEMSSEVAFLILEHAGLPRIVGDSAVPGLNRETALQHEIVVPEVGARLALTDRVRPLFKRGTAAEVESHSLATLRDTLLPQLMSGRLRVKDAEKIVADAT